MDIRRHQQHRLEDKNVIFLLLSVFLFLFHLFFWFFCVYLVGLPGHFRQDALLCQQDAEHFKRESDIKINTESDHVRIRNWIHIGRHFASGPKCVIQIRRQFLKKTLKPAEKGNLLGVPPFMAVLQSRNYLFSVFLHPSILKTD